VKSLEAVLYVCGAIISPFAFNLHAYKSNFLPLLDLGRDHGEYGASAHKAAHAPLCVRVHNHAAPCPFLYYFLRFAHFASRATKAAGMNKI
jgi:hypothetical protein